MNSLIVVELPICTDRDDQRGLCFDSYGHDAYKGLDYQLVMLEDDSLYFRFQLYVTLEDASFDQPIINEYHEDYPVTANSAELDAYFRAAWTAYAEEVDAVAVFRPDVNEETV